MVDPFTAVALTAAIIYFVKFGCKVLKAGYGTFLVAHHRRDEDLTATMVIADLEDLTARLKSTSNKTTAGHSNDEQALRNLAEQCLELAKDLRALLNSLTPSEDVGFPTCDLLRTALRKSMKADKT